MIFAPWFLSHLLPHCVKNESENEMHTLLKGTQERIHSCIKMIINVNTRGCVNSLQKEMGKKKTGQVRPVNIHSNRL